MSSLFRSTKNTRVLPTGSMRYIRSDALVGLTDAEKQMPGNDKEKTLIFNPGQKALMQAAAKRGYGQNFVNENYVIDFRAAALNAPLPEGFHFVKPGYADPVKLAVCTWKGFDHGDKGPFVNWEAAALYRFGVSS